MKRSDMVPKQVMSEQDKKIVNSGRCAAKNGTSSVGGYNFMPFDGAPEGTYDRIFNNPKNECYVVICDECGRTFHKDSTSDPVDGHVPNCYHH